MLIYRWTFATKYSRGGYSGNPHMNHLYIHLFALTCSPRYPLQAACISHLLHLSGKKTTLVVIFFNDLLDIIDIPPTLPNLVLHGNCFPHTPGPESFFPHMTWRPLGIWPPCHRSSGGLKTKDLCPLNGPGHGQTLQQLSAKKDWYNSEMVVFTKIVIISAVSDGFLKFQKF